MITSKDKIISKTDGEGQTALESNHHSPFSTLNSQLLKKYWGYDSFRGIQQQIIESIEAGHDTLGLMPTGGGKSITFQVPALAMEGVCVVITPLIALMKDQVQHLRQHGIIADAIYSGMQRDSILRILENCIFGKTKLLYVSPERLTSEIFQTKLRHIKVSFITVDEAHCISQWGYDFRPSYLTIADIRRLHPEAPVLALTATATPQVADDICQKLSQPSTLNPQRSTLNAQPSTFTIFRMSFERKNLSYIVRTVEDKRQELLRLLQANDGAAIVYVRSRQHAKETAEMLKANGLSATFYHAGLDHMEKDLRQRDWTADRTRVIVATNAFGMGIDKPDVRLVIHTDCPDSLEAYFQEAGRAGRDGLPAQAILLYNAHDSAKLEKRIADTFPEKAYIRQVYEHLAYFYQVATGSGYGIMFEFNADEFCRRFHHFPIQVESALHILSRAGYIEYVEEQENAARVMFTVGRSELYRLEGHAPEEDRVIVSLLRNYGGLFSDYCFIDERLIAQQAGLTPQQAYLALKSLSQKHIIHFIPRRKTPYIRYTQRREDPEHIMLPPAIYEERRQQYRQRIKAMINYATSENQCRSGMLLRYFGEKPAHACGHCDVCAGMDYKRVRSAQQAIRQLLSDGKPHPIVELHQLLLPPEEVSEALHDLLAEDIIRQQDHTLYLT